MKKVTVIWSSPNQEGLTASAIIWFVSLIPILAITFPGPGIFRARLTSLFAVCFAVFLATVPAASSRTGPDPRIPNMTPRKTMI